MTPLYQLRRDLANAVTAATGVTTYPGTVANPYTPSVMIEGNGWQTDTGCQVTYEMAVTVLGSARDIIVSLDDVEDLGRRVYLACANHGCLLSPAGAPTVVTVSGDGFLAVQFTATVLAPELP